MNKFIEEREVDYNTEALAEIQLILDSKYEFLPKDKRTKNFQKLKDEYNSIVFIYNTRAKNQIFSKIK